MGNGDILFLRNLSGKQWKRVSVGSTVNCDALGSNPCQAKFVLRFVLHLHTLINSVTISGGSRLFPVEANPTMVPSSLAIDFGPPSNKEINMRYWETY